MLLADFLIERLANIGIKHVFAIPGEDVLDFCKILSESKKIQVITCTDASHAGFAADAYARVKGAGCVLAPYKVGASKLISTTECAYAERSPVVILSGAPAAKDRKSDGFASQKELFEKITCCNAVLSNPGTAGYDIDNAMVMLNHYKRPIYFEIPRDTLKKSLTYDVFQQGTPNSPKSDPANLWEILDEVADWLQASKNPVILAGVEVARCGLGDSLIRFAEKGKIPIVVTPLSKSVINENHPLFSGVYTRDSSPAITRELVENSDCLMMLGVMFSDTVPEKRDAVHASIDQLKVRNHTFNDVNFLDFLHGLFKLGPNQGTNVQITAKRVQGRFEPKDVPVTVSRLFEQIDCILNPSVVVTSDVGDSLYAALDLTVHEKGRFYCPAFYSSMGFAIPGALGIQVAEPQLRPVAVVGDWAFQMSMSELNTIAQLGLTPVVVVLNNGGSVTHRQLVDGPFNNIRSWAYHKVPDMLGYGNGFEVKTEEALAGAIKEAMASKTLNVINVQLSPKDASARMRMLGVKK